MKKIAKEPLKRVDSMRHKFSADEDERLKELVGIYGIHSWKKIASLMEGRNTRQCRERYINYLSPNLVNGPWTSQEDRFLISLVKRHGSSWAKIVKHFPTRSDVNIKNRYSLLASKGRAPVLMSDRCKTKCKKIETNTPKNEPHISFEELIDASIADFREMNLNSKNDCLFNLFPEDLLDLSF